VLHTLVDPDEDANQFRAWLSDQGIRIESLAPMEPTIEDVFVSLIQSE
jgi:hypothetical protein